MQPHTRSGQVQGVTVDDPDSTCMPRTGRLAGDDLLQYLFQRLAELRISVVD